MINVAHCIYKSNRSYLRAYVLEIGMELVGLLERPMELLIGLHVIVASRSLLLDVVKTMHQRMHFWEMPAFVGFSMAGACMNIFLVDTISGFRLSKTAAESIPSYTVQNFPVHAGQM